MFKEKNERRKTKIGWKKEKMINQKWRGGKDLRVN